MECRYNAPNEIAKKAIIELVASFEMNPQEVIYKVEHFAIINYPDVEVFQYDENEDPISSEMIPHPSSKVYITRTERSISIEDYNQFSVAVDNVISTMDITGLSPFEIEQLRVKIGLYIYVTQLDVDSTDLTAYDLTPSQWELQ